VDIAGITDLQALLTRDEGWFWLKTDIQADNNQGILLYGTSLGWTAWLNGEKIAASGSGPPFWHPSSGLPELVRVPEGPEREKEILLKVYLRRGYTRAPGPPEVGDPDRLELRLRLTRFIVRNLPLTSFILGLVVFLIFLAGGTGRKGNAQQAFGLFGLFMALISLETVLSAIPQLPLYIPWTALSLSVRISLPFTMIFWRKTVSTAGGKESPALMVLDFLAAAVTAFWISAPLADYPLIPLRFRVFFGFDPLPWFALYTWATALALWLNNSTRPHPGRIGTLLVLLFGTIPSLLLFVLYSGIESLSGGFLRYGLPLSLITVFILQIGMRRVLPQDQGRSVDDIEELTPIEDNSPEVDKSVPGQSRVIHGIRSTLYPLSIPWDPLWDIASAHQGPGYAATGFHDLYLDTAGHLEGFSFMDCGDGRLEGLLFTRLVQKELRRCFASNSTLPGMIRTTNNRSVQAAGTAGTTMRGVAGRFGNDSLNFISLSAQPLLHRRENGKKVADLGSDANPAIGIRMYGSAGLKTTKVPMNKDDMILIFTPGIIGLESPAGESLGMERLSAALAGSKAERATSILADITGMLKDFCEKDAVPAPLQMLLLRRR
jgi:hypothetical protein